MQIHKMNEKFQKLTTDIQEKNDAQSRSFANSQKSEKERLSNEFDADRRTLKRMTNSIVNSGNRGDEARMETERVKKSLGGRIASLKNKVSETRDRASYEKDSLTKEMQGALKQRDNENRDQIEQLAADNSKFTGKLLSKFRNAKDEIVSRYKKGMSSQEINNEKRSLDERRDFKLKLSNQRRMFGETLNDLSDRNSKSISKLQKDFAQEKTDFIEKSKIDTHHSNEELKDTLKTVFSKKEEALQKRLDSALSNNSRLTEQFDRKVASIKKKNADEMRLLKQQGHEQRIEDRRSTKRLVDERGQKDLERFLTVKKKFDEKISQVKSHNEIQTSKIVERYEDQIDQAKREDATKFKRKVSEMEREYSKMMKTNELKLSAVVNKYELKLDKLRQANREARELRTKRA
jgi:hypothetical protein